MARRSKAERALELAKEIFRLEQALISRRAEFERLVGRVDEQLALPLQSRESYPRRVRALLDGFPEESFSLEQIVMRLSEEDDVPNIKTVRATLSKLIASRAVERTGPGLYRARDRSTDNPLLAAKGGTK